MHAEQTTAAPQRRIRRRAEPSPSHESAAVRAPSVRAQPARSLGPGAQRLLRGARVLSVLGLLAFAAHALFGLGGKSVDVAFEEWLFTALFFAGAALCLARARCSPVERGAWFALGVGLACWSVGELVFVIDPREVTAASFPAPSDYLWLTYYPATFIALGLLVRARVRHFYPSVWLDGLVGAFAIAGLACEFVLPPILAASGGSVGQVVGDLIYPLGDVLLLTFVVGVLAVTGWRPGRVLATVSFAVVLATIADCASLSSSAAGGDGSTIFDALWPASAVALGFAAWQPVRPAAVIGLAGRRLLVIPLLFAGSALGLLVLAETRPLQSDARTFVLLTLAAAFVRMGLTFSENVSLVDRSREEALTDPLTCLGNRRRLLLDLDDVLQSASVRSPAQLVLCDLNGFKRYNDTFGHPMGDALLARLGVKLAEHVGSAGRAYRLGGDEFCVLVRAGADTAEAIEEAVSAALTERGQGFAIATACGSVLLPLEAEDGARALQLADQRLYANKPSRQSTDASTLLRDVLLAAIAEREPELPGHLQEVGSLARAVAQRLGLRGEELEVAVRAAELHDVGKLAIPDAILQKPAPLDASERAIIERHCEAGERILVVAPPMGPVGQLVRASHERYDGKGYPDGLRREEIPLGARIISVCDAFHAMTSDRPYEPSIDPADAIAELRRCAGSQFDPAVVEAFCSTVETAAVGDLNGVAEALSPAGRRLEAA